MTQLKVMTVIGTRPEIIRLSRVMAKLDRYCDHRIVHTGQNHDYELNEVFFAELGLRRPDHFLDAAGSGAAETIANVIARVDALLVEHRPDAFLVLGDTNSCLSVIPAKRRKVPIFHMEAGNRCFDLRVPEEINRRIVDHTADVNLTYSSIARECLLREGLSPDLVIKTGSPMPEVLDYFRDRIADATPLQRLGLQPDGYFVVSVHREENVDTEVNLTELASVLDRVAVEFGLPIIVSTHPRTQRRITEFQVEFNPLIQFLRPLGFLDYIALQSSARAVLSDSGTISEESSILGFPALTLRESQERHEAVEEAAVMMVGMNVDRVLQGLRILADQGRGDQSVLRRVSDYSMLNVSEKVVRIIHSHTDYVNRVVWRRATTPRE